MNLASRFIKVLDCVAEYSVMLSTSMGRKVSALRIGDGLCTKLFRTSISLHCIENVLCRSMLSTHAETYS